MVSAKFEEIYQRARGIKKGPSNDEQLELYSLAKVAKEVDISTADKPGMFNIEGKYKYNAWQKKVKEGLSAEDAEAQYIELAEKLIATHLKKSETTEEEKSEPTKTTETTETAEATKTT